MVRFPNHIKRLGTYPSSLGGSSVDVLQTAGRGDEQNVAKSFGIGLATDLGVPVLGKALARVSNPIPVARAVKRLVL